MEKSTFNNEAGSVNRSYKPGFLNYILGDNKAWFIAGFTILFVACWRAMEMITHDGLITWPVYAFVFPVLIGSVPVMLALRTIQFGSVAYELSQEKIIIREGIVGSTFKVIRLSDVKKIEINRNLAQRIANAGTIRFYTDSKEYDAWTGTDKNYEEWSSVSNPKQIVEVIMGMTTA